MANPMNPLMMGAPSYNTPLGAAAQQPQGFGARLKNFAFGPEALQLAAGLLSEQSFGKGMGQGLQNVSQFRDRQNVLGRDDRDFQFRQAESGRDQRNADRNYSLAERKLIADRESAAKFGMQPIFMQDESGNIGVGQLTSDGRLLPSQLPDGYKPMSPGQKASDIEAGKGEGKNRGALPGALAAADRLVGGVDDLLRDPALPNLSGPLQSWMPNLRGDTNRAQSKLDQIQGGTFLQAFNDLRGGGQITEKEGEKATAAYNRLASTGMNDADYRQALEEFKSEVLKLREIAIQRAGGGAGGNGYAPIQSGESGAVGEDGWTTLSNGIRFREVR